MPVQPIQAFYFRDFKNAHVPEILDEIYLKEVYKPFLFGRKDLLIADWGGNIGLTSYYFKDFAKQVFCVEPAKDHQEVISKLIEQNNIKNILLCKYAISNKNGKTKFYHPENATMYSMENMMGVKDYEEVETVSVDQFFKRNNIDHLDLLKLDVEGSECEIIASDGFKEYAPKIQLIVGEWHQWAKTEKNQFANMFADLGFQFNWLYNTQASVFTAVRL